MGIVDITDWKKQHERLLEQYETLKAMYIDSQRWAKAWKVSARSHRNRMNGAIGGLAKVLAELIECQQQRDALAEALKELYNLSLYSHQGFDSKNCPVCAALDKAQAALAMLEDKK